MGYPFEMNDCQRFCLTVFLFLLLPLFLASSGCTKNPATGRVTGVVTYDGKPLPQADIRFIPDPLGPRGAIAKTDQSGRYDLMYSENVAGVIPGKYKVVISTRGSTLPDPGISPPADEGGSATPYSPYDAVPSSMTMGAGTEMLPMKYCSSRETILTAEVKEGPNTIDFHLDSSEGD